MVSEFLLETIGKLKLTDELTASYPDIPKDARKYLRSGKNEEGWWTAEHLLNQVVNSAIPIFNILYPNAIAIFAFDNSTNYGAMAKDELNAINMNLNSSDKKSCMHMTYYGPNQTSQSMVFPHDHPKFSNQ